MPDQIGTPLLEGTLLENRYRIRGLLGQGGMSRVYLADATHLGMLVAVKENLQTTPEARAQFEREGQLLARLTHPNISRVIDRFTDAMTGRQYLVMEYVEGEDLAAMIKRVGPLPEVTVLAWIRQILNAVEYLHSQDPPIIHRDIKPANIKITPQGKAVLVDFGISKFYDPSRGTMTGMPAVTAGYAPPEQHDFKTTQRSDVYALGATLYTMLTGRVPPNSLLRQTGREVLVPPGLSVPISARMNSTILRALEMEDTKRWQSVSELRAALAGQARAQLPTTHPQTVSVRSRAATAEGVSSVFGWLVLGALATFLLIMIVVVVGGLFARRVAAPAAATNVAFVETTTPTSVTSTAARPAASTTQTMAPTALPQFLPTSTLNAPAARSLLRLPGREPPTLDPSLAQDVTSHTYVAEIFSGLVALDRALNVVPDIAEKWSVSGDGTVYTFALRKGVRFHDGRLVTAQDFKYSIERAADPATGSPTAGTYLNDIIGVKERLAGKASSVSGVQVIDDFALRITIDAPKPYCLAKLAYPVAYVVDKDNVARGGSNWTDKPNGTGPFKLKEYVRGQRIVLVKNGDYYLDPKPQVDQIDFTLSATSLAMYEKGDLDALQVPNSDVNRVLNPSDPLNKELSVGPELGTYFIVFNVRKPPFDDTRVRQAFALAIDRQKIVSAAYYDVPLLAKSILPPGMPGYSDTLPDIGYNPSQARQLLAESKYAGKLPDIVWTASGTGSTPGDVARIVAMLKENLGVGVRIEQTDSASFSGKLYGPGGNPYQIFRYGWIADYVDPQDFVEILFRSDSTHNWSGYSNLEVDRLIDQAAVEKDTQHRLQLYQQAEQLILRDYPIVPVFHPRNYWLTKPYVKGKIYPAMPISHLRYVSISQ